MGSTESTVSFFPELRLLYLKVKVEHNISLPTQVRVLVQHQAF